MLRNLGKTKFTYSLYNEPTPFVSQKRMLEVLEVLEMLEKFDFPFSPFNFQFSTFHFHLSIFNFQLSTFPSVSPTPLKPL